MLIPLNDLIEEHTVNLKHWLEERPDIKKLITAPDGNIYGIPAIDESLSTQVAGVLGMNMTWLKNLGLEIPTTIDEFTEVLRAFKTQDPNKNGEADEIPLSFRANNAANRTTWIGSFFGPFGVVDDSTHIMVKDGKVIFTPEQEGFRKALEYTKRKERLETGNRDNFFYCLGNQCYHRHITEEEAVSLAHSHFGDLPDFDLELPLHNAYQYTSKTDQAEEESQQPRICQVIKFMDEHYEIRRNVVKEQIEFRKIIPDLPKTEQPPFSTLRTKDVNTFYINAQMKKIYSSQANLKALVDSDYAKPFNPFIHYFTSLQTWDGKTDHIGQLTKTVKAADQAFFEDSFRRWLVGMVACAIDDEAQNHQLMLLHGAQGKGKSTFVRHLLPPELKDYYRNGMISPDNKDHLLQMSSCLPINLDEFDTLSPARMQELKSLITQDVMNERKVYDIQNYTFIRRASFIASTNNPHCLPDIGENRRILFNTLLEIDYHTPVNHQGIYAQAYALYRQGFQYWYENQEITFLNNRNEAFRQKDPVEENLFFYFRAARPNDIQAKWYPASQLLSVLSMNGRTQANAQMKQMLVTVLENNHFHSRKTSNNITEYWVVEYSAEERKENSIRPQLPVQTGLEL